MTDSPRPNPYAPGWACPTCGAEHLYDCPNIEPVAFMKAVMHDLSLPLTVRMKAAHELLKLKAKGITSDPIEPEPRPRPRP
jgi:hypothetical protein